MDFNSWRHEYIQAHENYTFLAWEYGKALRAWGTYPSDDSWKQLQESIRELKRQGEIIVFNRMMLYEE